MPNAGTRVPGADAAAAPKTVRVARLMLTSLHHTRIEVELDAIHATLCQCAFKRGARAVHRLAGVGTARTLAHRTPRAQGRETNPLKPKLVARVAQAPAQARQASVAHRYPTASPHSRRHTSRPPSRTQDLQYSTMRCTRSADGGGSRNLRGLGPQEVHDAIGRLLEGPPGNQRVTICAGGQHMNVDGDSERFFWGLAESMRSGAAGGRPRASSPVPPQPYRAPGSAPAQSRTSPLQQQQQQQQQYPSYAPRGRDGTRGHGAGAPTGEHVNVRGARGQSTAVPTAHGSQGCNPGPSSLVSRMSGLNIRGSHQGE